MGRHSVRDQAAEQFDTNRIVGDVIEALHRWAISTKQECTSVLVQ
jgi:hypothetical protein